jgi:signal transduction histidine kinase
MGDLTHETAQNSLMLVEKIRTALRDSEFLTKLLHDYKPGDVLVRENQPNRQLIIILKGSVEQIKHYGTPHQVPVDIMGPGMMVGLLSYHTGQPAFSTVVARSRVSTLSATQKHVQALNREFPELGDVLQSLIVGNLADRYKRMVLLHVEVKNLSDTLQMERNHLRRTVQELESTRNFMVNQEKMATLGELMAGLAHEINNPASALLRSVDFLSTALPEVITDQNSSGKSFERDFFIHGMNAIAPATDVARSRLNQLSKEYPNLDRKQLRKLVRMDDAHLDIISGISKEGDKERFNHLLQIFESGVFIKSINISTQRIQHLVQSLKSYSRQNTHIWESADVRDGINDTLLLLGHRLNRVELERHFASVPNILCMPGELNQVWTNIICNACDAMNDEGRLIITCGLSAGDKVFVTIRDSGPGIREDNLSKIFDANFTTKSAGGEFGLGLGLAISSGIIKNHRGSIMARNHADGGAEFKIELPVAPPNPL